MEGKMAGELWNDPELNRIRKERNERFAETRVIVEDKQEYDRLHPYKMPFSFRDDVWEPIKVIFGGILRMYGLMSRDPYIARISMIEEAQRQIGIQRQISSQQHMELLGATQMTQLQARRAREEERAEARSREEARARILARAMVQEMKAEVDRERRRGA